MISLIQHFESENFQDFEADFPQKGSLKILKIFTHVLIPRMSSVGSCELGILFYVSCFTAPLTPKTKFQAVNPTIYLPK